MSSDLPDSSHGIFKWIQNEIAQNRHLPLEAVQLDSILADDLLPDSFEMIELVSVIESEFKIRIKYEQTSELQTVSDLVQLIDSLINR
ncbi:MAG: acyl carrier protein [Pirellulales bacterium]|jgi:acyl carrier protein